MNIPIPGKLGRAVILIRDYVIGNPVIFAILSAALWIVGFPKRKETVKAGEK